jgi:hypothetical protein
MAIEDIKVIHNFISKEECNELVEYQKYLTDNNLWDVGSKDGDPLGQWSNRFINAGSLALEAKGLGKEYDLNVLNILISIRKRIRNEIMTQYNLDKLVYADCLNLIKWPHGYVQPAHSDFENLGGQPHIYNWRQIGCVLYLNDDFDGGQIHFPQHGVSIPVKPGMLAFFPGDVHHMHGVHRVLNGTRYTISSFWTEFERHKDNLEQ